MTILRRGLDVPLGEALEQEKGLAEEGLDQEVIEGAEAALTRHAELDWAADEAGAKRKREFASESRKKRRKEATPVDRWTAGGIPARVAHREVVAQAQEQPGRDRTPRSRRSRAMAMLALNGSNRPPRGGVSARDTGRDDDVRTVAAQANATSAQLHQITEALVQEVGRSAAEAGSGLNAWVTSRRTRGCCRNCGPRSQHCRARAEGVADP